MAEKTMNELVREARATLGLYVDGELARFLGVSRRTVQRHTHSAGIPMGNGHEKLVRALYPRDPALALAIARSHKIDLSDLIAAAKPAAPPAVPAAPAAPSKPEARREHAAHVILAACDALNMLPRDVRPALAAIFGQARGLGVDLDQLAKLLSEGEPAKGKKAAKA